MTTINVSLPEPLEAFAREQARRYGFSDAGAYLRALVDADHRQADEELESKLLEGLDSEPIQVTTEFWTELRSEATQRRSA